MDVLNGGNVVYENEFQRILEAAQNNALTFFVGAGVSKVSNAPSWKELINSIYKMINRTPKGDGEDYSADEYLQIPQMYYYTLGDDKKQYFDLVKEKIQDNTLIPNNIHREIFKLNPVSILTTNYDTQSKIKNL